MKFKRGDEVMLTFFGTEYVAKLGGKGVSLNTPIGSVDVVYEGIAETLPFDGWTSSTTSDLGVEVHGVSDTAQKSLTELETKLKALLSRLSKLV